jgi:hypothetical protein
MTVFDVYLNDRKCCRAGVGDDGVLTAIVDWVKLTGPAAREARRRRQPVEETRLHVGGLGHGAHHSWLERHLRTGDRVAIVVGKARSADRPVDRKPRLQKPAAPAQTTFLNVDLDIRSRSPLEGLASAFGRGVIVLHVGPEGHHYVAHLETAITAPGPDRLIRRFVELIKRLPRAERRIWDRAQLREFNIGIQSAVTPPSYTLQLDPATVRAAASVNAGIGVTVYACA